MKRILLFAMLVMFSETLFSQTTDSLAVNFDFDKSELQAAAIAKLDSFINKISSYSVLNINLGGFCDSKGTNSYNDGLSLRRVNAVKKYLQNQQGFKTIRILSSAFGENRLLNSDLTDEEGYQNRRVEIIASLAEKTGTTQEKTVITEVKAVPGSISETRSLTTILEDTALKKGSLITLKNIEFQNASDILLSKSIPVLEELFDILVKNPTMAISIEGHICCVISVAGIPVEQSPSFYVSVIRAKRVWSYLIQKGIDPARLSYKGFGNSNPIFPIPERSEEERIANRRVEIRIVEK